MNKDVLRKWVDALRSGNFKQTKGRLSKIENDGSRTFCCLGVLCELAKDEIGLEETYREGLWFRGYGGEFAYNGCETLPPDSVEDFLGEPGFDWEVKLHEDVLYEDGEEVMYEAGDLVELAELNDEGDWTFAQIADAIESQYLR